MLTRRPECELLHHASWYSPDRTIGSGKEVSSPVRYARRQDSDARRHSESEGVYTHLTIRTLHILMTSMNAWHNNSSAFTTIWLLWKAGDSPSFDLSQWPRNSPAGNSPPSQFGAQKRMLVFMQSACYCSPNSTRTWMCRQILVELPKSNFMKIRSPVVQLLHANRRKVKAILNRKSGGIRTRLKWPVWLVVCLCFKWALCKSIILQKMAVSCTWFTLTSYGHRRNYYLLKKSNYCSLWNNEMHSTANRLYFTAAIFILVL
jgi:hypothetical protein